MARLPEKIRKLTNSEKAWFIGEYIPSERDRQILVYQLVDGWTYEKIADKYGLSPRRVAEILRKGKEILLKNL